MCGRTTQTGGGGSIEVQAPGIQAVVYLVHTINSSTFPRVCYFQALWSVVHKKSTRFVRQIFPSKISWKMADMTQRHKSLQTIEMLSSFVWQSGPSLWAVALVRFADNFRWCVIWLDHKNGTILGLRSFHIFRPSATKSGLPYGVMYVSLSWTPPWLTPSPTGWHPPQGSSSSRLTPPLPARYYIVTWWDHVMDGRGR